MSSKMNVTGLPTATYRWQFHSGFRFSDAAALAPYLAELGISHCYASPYLKAHPGSVHGYDIADHNAINPEIGTDDERREFVVALKRSGIGQIIDIVPNHMTVNDPNNRWWWDVLEYGERSHYAHYFDIDWRTPEREYAGKVVIPILGDQYGRVLESGHINLAFDSEKSALVVQYFEHKIPIGPSSYPFILAHIVERLSKKNESNISFVVSDIKAISAVFEEHRLLRDKDRASFREARKAIIDARIRLGQVLAGGGVCEAVVSETLAFLSGQGRSEEGQFDLLHKILEEQSYRLAFWRVSGAEINYRRFFDINDLAALRMENPEVFAAAHALVGQWIAAGDIDGLRIDHPDGLREPEQYFRRLNKWASALLGEGKSMAGSEPSANPRSPLYLVVEKILEPGEILPCSWPVHGTTGYDFTNLLNGIFIDPKDEGDCDKTYYDFVGGCDDYKNMLYECKKLIMHTGLASGIQNLGLGLEHIAESNRMTRDFTRSALTGALFEIVANFPVYRTYVAVGAVTEQDRRFVQAACDEAKARSPLLEPGVVEFIQGVLLLEDIQNIDGDNRRDILDWVATFQQYTGPVMAKGLEDTLLYRYNRFVSLNEVGGDPSRFGVTLKTFHEANQARLKDWPDAMLCTSSHDTKRSEDVRARLDVLSETGALWRDWVLGLKARHDALKGDDCRLSARDEYLFYQTLVGIWPLRVVNDAAWTDLRERLLAYMLKAAREAKLDTSWVTPNSLYEGALSNFIVRVLDPAVNPGLAREMAWLEPVMEAGLWTSLSQVALKLLVPGVPDFYQGMETWDLSLVDPDNRRPVDYALRANLMSQIMDELEDARGRASCLRSLMASPKDGRIKMYLTRELLRLRRSMPELFARGEYVPLQVFGPKAHHIVAFMRRSAECAIVVAVPRLYWRLTSGGNKRPWANDVWSGTFIEGLAGLPHGSLCNVLSGECLDVDIYGTGTLSAQVIFNDCPIAVLLAV